MFGERLRQLRQTAVCEAETLLREKGFTYVDEGWRGVLDGAGHGEIPIQLQFPEDFPDGLPEVFIDRQKLKRQIPHVEKNGKVCVVPSTGTLVDASNPRSIVNETLERALRVLIVGLSGSIDEHFHEEFLAYWNPCAHETFLSICDPAGSARELCIVRIEGGRMPEGSSFLVAESLAAAEKWLGRLNGKVKERRTAFFLPLTSPLLPPNFDEVPSSDEMLEKIRSHATAEVYDAFRAWLNHPGLPIIVILSMPLKANQGHVLTALRFEEAKGKSKQQALCGYRPATLPAWRELQFTRHQPVTPIRLERFDVAYLLPRGGTTLGLLSRTVVVVGCGAVGSHVAERIASLGIGKIRLVDHDSLRPENVQRHALGVKYVGVNKAKGLCEELGARFPHITVEYREKKIQAILQDEPGFVMEADLVIIATGDETLELRLNDLFRHRIPRLHAWLDPLGIGGHVLATGVTEKPGCFYCLFQIDAEHGLTNTASFARAGQFFQKSYAGCAGTFTPFAGVHADRTAMEAASLAARILLSEETENVLISWFGDPSSFEQAGFVPSPRATLFHVGESRRETRYARSDCPVCQEMIL